MNDVDLEVYHAQQWALVEEWAVLKRDFEVLRQEFEVVSRELEKLRGELKDEKQRRCVLSARLDSLERSRP